MEDEELTIYRKATKDLFGFVKLAVLGGLAAGFVLGSLVQLIIDSR